MTKHIWTLGLALFFIHVTGYTTEPKMSEAPAKPAPQMAGMGFVSLPTSQRHECTQALNLCASHCKSISGADCEVDCQADCEVCAMDLAEEASKVCNK